MTIPRPILPLLLVVLGSLLFARSVSAKEASFGLSILGAACVSGENVILGEIARPMDGLGAGEWEQLSSQELWPSPPAGRPMVMDQDMLSRMLRKHLGEDLAGRCVLPRNIALQRGGAVLVQSELASLVVKSLTPMAQVLGGEAEFRDYRLPEYIFLAEEHHRIAVELVSDLKPGRLSFNLLEIDSANARHRQVSGSVFLDLWVSVPCATRPVNRGEELTPELIGHRRKNMAYLRGEAWDGLGGPWRIAQPVGMGQVLYKDCLAPLPVISRGGKVSLVFQGKFIRLEVPAEALADGGNGESILVRNLQSNRQILAKVVDADTVQVR